MKNLTHRTRWLAGSVAGFAFFTPFSIAGAHLCLGLAVLIAVSSPSLLKEAWVRLRGSPLGLPLLFWIVAHLLSVALAVDPAHSATKLNKLALLTLLPLGALSVARNSLRFTIGGLCFATAVVSVIGVVIHFMQGGGLEARNRGAGGFYMTVAGVAMVVSLLAMGELFAALKDPRPRRVGFLAVCFFLTLVALLATYTRGSWIGFGVGALLLLRRHRWALAAFFVGGLVLLALGPPEARDRLASSINPDHPRNVERVAIWKHGLEIFAHYPWTGTGPWIPDEILKRDVVTSQGVVKVHSHMHNSLLQIAVTLGIVGLGAFLYLLGAIARMASRSRSEEIRNLWEEGLVAAYPAIFIALLVNGMFEWNFGDSEILGLFYLLTGSVWGIASPSKV